MTDAIFITTVVLVGVVLLFTSYCKFLKHKIGNDKAQDSEFDVDLWD